MKHHFHQTSGSTIRRVSTRLPTRWGNFKLIAFEREISNGMQHIETALALVMGDLKHGAPLVRVHSQCFTGEVLGSLRCDCGAQLDIAMQAIAEERRGLIIYEHQEGRGIGLMGKLEAYALQDVGLDTVDANVALGFKADYRDFSLPAEILHRLGVTRVRLLTNNPHKSRVLTEAGIEIVAQIPCEAAPTPHSIKYFRAKQQRMGHVMRKTPNFKLQASAEIEVPDTSAIIHSPVHFEPSLGTKSAATGGRTHSSRDAIFEHPDPCRSISPVARSDPDAIASDAEAEFASIDDALRELRAGRMIVVVDDEDRENEGDLTMAAEMVTPQAVNFMATHGKGLICLAMTGERLNELELGPMVADSTSLGGTAFTVSIDVKGPEITTGISAHDRAETIRAAIDVNHRPEDFGRPGHVFPLRARDGGVLERRGQTEAAVDLASLAGLYPAGAICEIVNEDGSMARVPDLARFCRKHGLLMVTVAELARYRFELDFEGSLGAIDGVFPVRSLPA